MDGLSSSHHCSVVRPKERRPDVHQNPFMRGNTIIRSKTFSPGPQSQYICRVTGKPAESDESDAQVLFISPLHCFCFCFSSDQPQRQRQLHPLQEVSVRQERLRETQHANEEGTNNRFITFSFFLLLINPFPPGQTYFCAGVGLDSTELSKNQTQSGCWF